MAAGKQVGQTEHTIFIPSIGWVIWKGNFCFRRLFPTSTYLLFYLLYEYRNQNNLNISLWLTVKCLSWLSDLFLVYEARFRVLLSNIGNINRCIMYHYSELNDDYSDIHVCISNVYNLCILHWKFCYVYLTAGTMLLRRGRWQ